MPLGQEQEIIGQEPRFGVEPFNGSFHGKDIISVEQFTSGKEIKILFEVADRMRRSVEEREIRKDLKGYCVALLFYQPSTRTFSSFSAAVQRLGASYEIPIPGMKAFSSAAKGESLRDTIQTIEQTTAADVIVLRHPEDSSSQEAAQFAKVPIINAGSGRLAHPTQAILDLYTIREKLGRMDGLTVTMIGDLKNGRTIKSLAKLLTLGDGIRFNFISPPILRMPEEVSSYLKQKGAKVAEGNSEELRDVLGETDVLYVTRVQEEWFVHQAMREIKEALGGKAKIIGEDKLLEAAEVLGEGYYQQAVEGYVVDLELLERAKEKMIVMHPLPRVGEIAYEVDDDSRAAYFRQMRNGLYTRMALLAAVLGKAKIPFFSNNLSPVLNYEP